MIIKLNWGPLRKVLDNSYLNSRISNFENDIGLILAFLNKLPSQFETPGMATADWDRLVLRDPELAYSILRYEANYQIRFVWVLSSFKISKLLPEIIDMLNHGKLYACTTMIRTLLEVVCFCDYHLHKIEELVLQLNSNVNNFDEYNKIHSELEKYFRHTQKSTRIPAIIKRGTDTVKSTSVMKCIKFVSKKPPYKNMLKFYSHLCECVHPNEFSNAIFGTVTKIYPNQAPLMNTESGVAFIPGEMDKYYLDLSENSYSQFHFMYIRMLLQTVLDCSIIFRDDVLKFSSLKVEKLKEYSSLNWFNSLSEDQKRIISRLSNEQIRYYE